MLGHCMGHKKTALLSRGKRVRRNHRSFGVKIAKQHREPHWKDCTLGIGAPTISFHHTLPSRGPERSSRRAVQTTFGNITVGYTGNPTLCVHNPDAGADRKGTREVVVLPEGERAVIPTRRISTGGRGLHAMEVMRWIFDFGCELAAPLMTRYL